MKGLLIKDFELALTQKKYFIFIMVMGAFIEFSSGFSSSGTFAQGYITILCGMFIITTVAYDEFDNGFEFLFLLPIHRIDYVKEKYLFGIITTFCGWLVGALLGIANNWIQGADGNITEILVISIYLFLAGITMIAFMFPFILEFGQEKGRYIFLGVFGVVLVIGYFIKDIAQNMLLEMLRFLAGIDMTFLLLSSLAGVFLLYLISCGISMAIMKKKEL